MADYIYLLEYRLSEAQKLALSKVREIARAKELTVFLVGGAVRDLTSGSRVHDLDVAVQGNALKLKKDLQKAGFIIDGELEASQSLFLRFTGNVRLEVGSTLSVTYPKPGKPVMKAATILDDLRRRDFTANAMALSLNEGSYGLLMDPLNGVADIENRELRLASNYGFIEDPVRMIRAIRFSARLGWQMEEKTQARYETGKAEGYISAINSFLRGYETEEIVHEEDPLRVLRALEHEGWLKRLAPGWSSSKANVVELEKLREAQMQLQMQGIVADASAAQFPLLTAKMAAKDLKDLKKSFPYRGFVAEIDALEGEAKRFAAELGSKQVSKPSQAWKLIMSTRPEVVLWVAYSTKNAALQAKFQSFYKEWPQARQRIPYSQMQEMRIVPELAGFDELVEKLFFELMDGHLGTVEEMKAFLEPYSPPAPPPTVHPRRARASKKDTKTSKARKKAETDEGLAVDGEGFDEAGLPVDDGAEAEPSTVVTTIAKAAKAEVAKTAGAKPGEKKVATATKAAVSAKPAAAAKTVAVKPGAEKDSIKKDAPKKLEPKTTAAANKGQVKKPAPNQKVTENKIAAKAVQVKKVVPKAVAAKAKPKAATKPGTKSGNKIAAKTGTKPAAKNAGKPAAKKTTKSSSKKKR